MSQPSCWLLTGTWHTRYRTPNENIPNDGEVHVQPVTTRPGYATVIIDWAEHTQPLPDNRHTSAAAQRETMPLAVLAADFRDHCWAVYVPSRLTAEAGLFHRVAEIAYTFSFTETNLAATTPPSAALVAEVVDRMPEFSTTVGSHECWYHTIDAEVEYEHKFTLDPDADIYALIQGIAAAIGDGEPDYLRLEFANAFEMWQFHNYVFEVTGPTSADCGYASFIPRRAGGHVVKRKRFRQDGFARYETKTTVYEELSDIAQMQSYLQRLGLEVAYLGEFVRTRFDNNIESIYTGNIYSIMADRCVFPVYPDTMLQQLEIEYLRSRGSERGGRREMIDELGALRRWTIGHLAEQAIPAKPGHLSKYTFLRTLAHALPHSPVDHHCDKADLAPVELVSPSSAHITALRVLSEAAAISGVDPTGAELIREGSNTIYRIGDLVARIGKPGTTDVAERELLISHWLNDSGVPTVVAADLAAPIAVVEGKPVTWWRTLREHRPSTPGELGTALRHLHALSPPTEFTLTHHQPFAGLRSQIDLADHIAVNDRAWLIARHDVLREQYAALEPSAHQTVIHGDAWQGNLVVPIDEPATFLDLDRVSLGRAEWDLVQIAADYTDFERLSPADYASFVDSYGDDHTAHSTFRLLADIQELRWTVFALSRPKASTTAAAQVRVRIACLRGEVPRPWRWDAL